MKVAHKIKVQSGQALLIVLLAMTVILTVVLSVVSRSVTDITITTFEEDAQRAFDAAEAGIEDYLFTGYATGTETAIGDATYKVLPGNPLPGDTFEYPTNLASGETATFWFVEHNTTSGKLSCDNGTCSDANRFEICWGSEATLSDDTPAIEVTILYDYNDGAGIVGNVISSGGDDFRHIKVARGAYDPYTLGRTFPSEFDSASTSCGISGEFEFSTDTLMMSGGSPDIPIPCTGIPECILMVKVKMFYNPDVEAVAIDVGPGTASLPSQGTEIDSEGVAGESTRRVNVFQSFPEPPFIFDSVIFSQGTLTK